MRSAGGVGRAGAGDGGDEAGFHLDFADDLVLGVHDVDVAIGTERDPLGTVQDRIPPATQNGMSRSFAVLVTHSIDTVRPSTLAVMS